MPEFIRHKDWDPPDWLKKAKAEHAIFHDKVVEVYEGYVDVNSLKLWKDNDRTLLDLEHLAKESGLQDIGKLSDEDIIKSIIKNGLHKIKELAKSIKMNGVRVPLIITYEKEILDGNRRFIACKYLLDTEEEQKDEFKSVLAYCLKPNLSKNLRYKIISEMNFLPDHKEKWPREVRAKYIRQLFIEYREKYGEKKAINEITFLLGIGKSDVYRFIAVLNMINEYKNFAKKISEQAEKEAELFAREKFQFFEEFYNKYIKAKVHSKGIKNDKELFYYYLFNKQLVSVMAIRDFAAMLQYPSIKKIVRKKKETLDYAKAIYDDAIIPKRTAYTIIKFCELMESLSAQKIRSIADDLKERLRKILKKIDEK